MYLSVGSVAPETSCCAPCASGKGGCGGHASQGATGLDMPRFVWLAPAAVAAVGLGIYWLTRDPRR